MKVYGKEPDQLENVNTIFQLVLSDYSYQQVNDAFRAYLKTNSDFPAPADIVNLIERGNKPPFKESIYVSINRKAGEDRTADEWKYLREYENFMMTGKY